MLDILLMLAGFVFLIKGADLLVAGAASIARRFAIPDLVVGLTVVAFGTSTPELFVNVAASAKGSTQIAVGNVLGSNIANILLILGVSSLIYPLAVTRGTVWREIPFSLLAVLVLGAAANDRLIDGAAASVLSRIDGIVFLAFFVVFLYYSFSIAGDIDGLGAHVPDQTKGVFRSLACTAAGLAGLIVGGKWIVDGAVVLAARFGMSQALVGLTVVAVGTSLPELATSAVAAYRRNAEIAVGNVVGSNIFNTFFVLGISAAIRPLPFEPRSNWDVGMVVLASLILFGFMFTGRKRSLDRWEGLLLLLGYVLYIGFRVGLEGDPGPFPR